MLVALILRNNPPPRGKCRTGICFSCRVLNCSERETRDDVNNIVQPVTTGHRSVPAALPGLPSPGRLLSGSIIQPSTHQVATLALYLGKTISHRPVPSKQLLYLPMRESYFSLVGQRGKRRFWGSARARLALQNEEATSLINAHTRRETPPSQPTRPTTPIPVLPQKNKFPLRTRAPEYNGPNFSSPRRILYRFRRPRKLLTRTLSRRRFPWKYPHIRKRTHSGRSPISKSSPSVP